MFGRILCANDGSERAFRALTLAVAMAKDKGAELHMVSVEEIDYMPEFIEEIREQTGTAARRFHKAARPACLPISSCSHGCRNSGKCIPTWW